VIDALSILLTHGLIMLAAWRMLTRDDLDVEPQAGTDVAPPAAAARLCLANQKDLSKGKADKPREKPREGRRDA